MLKREFFFKNSKNFFIDDINKIVDYVKENCLLEAENIIKKADDVVNKKFLFDLRWDLETVFKEELFEGEIDWLHIPGDDYEWTYQFNRHRFWICLGQAYALTGDEKYANAFKEQLIHWIENVPLKDKKNWTAWRTIEAGFRLEYWLKAICYFENSKVIDDEVFDIFEKSVIEHAEYLMKVYDDFRLISNWGIIQNHGLYLAGFMLPETERTKEYMKEALKRLSDEIDIQVYEDGVQWEQSTMYHNEVVHCYLDIKILAYKNNIILPKNIDEKIKKMCYATMYHKKPNNMELLMGDSDEIDVRDIVSIGAYLYNDNYLKYSGYEKLDYDCIWDLGYKAAIKYEDIKGESLKETAIELRESGNYYLRSNWERNGNFFHFYCGTLGAGHGHSDKLHIDLFSNREDILIDAGRYTYVDKDERYEFKDPSAHNTITVDDKDFIVCKDSWECSKLARSINQKFVSSKEYDYIEGGHLGYYNLENGGVFVNRRILYIKPDIYVIFDEMYGNGNHKYKQFFHFNNEGIVSLKDNNYVIYESEKNKVDFKFIGNDLLQETIKTRFSRHYNQCEDNVTVVNSFEKEGFTSVITVISTNDVEAYEEVSINKVPVKSNFKNIYFKDSSIEAINIEKGNRKFTVVLAHEDYVSPTDSFNADGCIGFGNIVIFNRTEENNLSTKILYR